LDPTSKIPEYKSCACRIERGDEMTEISAPPVPPGVEAYADATSPINDTRPPSAPQGRGTGAR
jgi:hypothetical protein